MEKTYRILFIASTNSVKGKMVRRLNGDNLAREFEAAFNERFGIVRRLLASGADINYQNRKGTTALMWAASYGRTEVVRFLVASRADMMLKDRRGRTVLHRANLAGQTDVVFALLEFHAEYFSHYSSVVEALVGFNIRVLGPVVERKVREAEEKKRRRLSGSMAI